MSDGKPRALPYAEEREDHHDHLVIKPLDTILFLGVPGSGKSSLANVLALSDSHQTLGELFWDPEQ